MLRAPRLGRRTAGNGNGSGSRGDRPAAGEGAGPRGAPRWGKGPLLVAAGEGRPAVPVPPRRRRSCGRGAAAGPESGAGGGPAAAPPPGRARREPRAPGSFLSLPVVIFFLLPLSLRLSRRVLHCSSSWAFPSVINKEAPGGKRGGGIPLSAAGEVSRSEVRDVNTEVAAAGGGRQGGGCLPPSRRELPLPAGSFI